MNGSAPPDLITIEQLTVHTIIGIHDHERHAPQPLTVDLQLTPASNRAFATDAIEDAVDYTTAAKVLQELAADHGLLLIEAFAEEAACRLLAALPVSEVTLHVRKPNALRGGAVAGVKITRQI